MSQEPFGAEVLPRRVEPPRRWPTLEPPRERVRHPPPPPRPKRPREVVDIVAGGEMHLYVGLERKAWLVRESRRRTDASGTAVSVARLVREAIDTYRQAR